MALFQFVTALRQHGSSKKPEVVFSFMVRQRLRETSQDAHNLVVERLRSAAVQGGAATPSGLAAEIRSLARLQDAARRQHGPVKARTMGEVHHCYVTIAATAIILAERATRPIELRRGEKSSTEKYRPPDFTVPDDVPA